MLDGDLVRIKTIIDTATYAIDADRENYQDKKYRYEMRYQNVIPKFKAIERFWICQNRLKYIKNIPLRLRYIVIKTRNSHHSSY